MGKDGDAAVPVCVYQQPDYLFEMFFLVFFVLYLLLQNYNIHHGVSHCRCIYLLSCCSDVYGCRIRPHTVFYFAHQIVSTLVCVCVCVC